MVTKALDNHEEGWHLDTGRLKCHRGGSGAVDVLNAMAADETPAPARQCMPA
ncbi:MAG: hypothetical protein JWO42_1574 [Chloroflexi bacterium]|nr:hypothetical protein [Chloroflexota bacterium]